MSSALPAELLEHIVQYVDGRGDLIHIAQASQLFLVLTRPHMDHHTIRTQRNHVELWMNLAQHDGVLASRIRSLTIVNSGGRPNFTKKVAYSPSLRLPPGIRPPDSADNGSEWPNLGDPPPKDMSRYETMLISALRHMISLKTFNWHCIPSPVIIEGPNSLWETVARLGTVTSVDFYDFGKARPVGQQQNTSSIHDYRGPNFGNIFLRAFQVDAKRLTNLTLRTYDPLENLYSFHDVQLLARQCCNLEVLDINMCDANRLLWMFRHGDPLIYQARWDHLRVFRLDGVRCTAPVLRRFFVAHPSLEEVCLGRSILGWEDSLALDLPSDALPALKVLHCTPALAVAFLPPKSADESESDSSSEFSVVVPPFRPIHALYGIELGVEIRLVEYAVRDVSTVAAAQEWQHLTVGELDKPRPSPWREVLLAGLRRQSATLRSVGLTSLCRAGHLFDLAKAVPGLTRLCLGSISEDLTAGSDETLISLYSLFPSLTSVAGHPFPEPEIPSQWPMIGTVDGLVPALTAALKRLKDGGCHELRSIGFQQSSELTLRGELVEGKAIIMPCEPHENGLKWVARHPWGTDEPTVFFGETIYGGTSIS